MKTGTFIFIPSKMQIYRSRAFLADSCPHMDFNRMFRTRFGVRFFTFFPKAMASMGLQLNCQLIPPYYILKAIMQVGLSKTKSFFSISSPNELAVSFSTYTLISHQTACTSNFMHNTVVCKKKSTYGTILCIVPYVLFFTYNGIMHVI